MLRRLGLSSFRPGLSFIALLSFITSFGGARLFATLYPSVVVEQSGIHFHHFWYGILLLGISGWLAIAWKSDRLDRICAVMYGLGAGFIGDEVGLLLTFGNYQSSLTYDFFIGALSGSILVILAIRYRAALSKEVAYLGTREGLILVGVFVAGFSILLFAFGSLSLGTPIAIVGIVVIVRELLTKHDPTIEGTIPKGVTVIAALSILSGANLIAAGIFNIFTPVTLSSTGLLELAGTSLAGPVLSFISTIFLALAIAALVLGSLKLLTGLILRTGKKWAWTLALVTSVCSIFLDAGSLGVSYSTVISSTVEFPTSLLAILYLTRPYVKAFYRRKSSSVVSTVPNI
ncbi:MAG TPA: hypothetical protein VFV92_09215 [Candidatus Bathyarchaeia archaeon]|nr:hypothetical protein [Candidatus Bathyarchaeia archaeon]